MPKTLFFYGFMLLFVLLVLEASSFVLVQLVDQDDFFDHRQSVLPTLQEDEFEGFRARIGDPTVGWSSLSSGSREEPDCLGNSIHYRYGDNGNRLYDGFNADDVRVVIAGDSYTHGDEAGGNQAYPAVLAERLRSSVANQGVGGYGPVQSFLALTQKTAAYDRAEVTVLAIMYENLYRMMNSYRPVLYPGASPFSLKPYMKDGALQPLPATPDFEAFRAAANAAFDDDFWAKPGARFPYLVSIVRSLTGNYFYFRKLQREFRKAGFPEYFLVFDDEVVTDNLVALLNTYAGWARESGVQPVVLFIPRNHLDTVSASQFLEQHDERLDTALLFGDVGAAEGVDWQRFNLREPDSDNTCHPSEYGYTVIADYLADLVSGSGALALQAAGPTE